jgi:hypothetical protein
VCGAALLFVGTGAARQTDDEVMQAFSQDIASYVALHERLERALPPLEPTRDGHVIAQARQALAAAIRAERADAVQGDIFTPAAARLFRARIAVALRGTDVAELLGELYEEFPDEMQLMPAVNAPFPRGATYEMPCRLLRGLPELPADLEYRLVGLHLVLWDTDANLVVDYIPNAIPYET